MPHFTQFRLAVQITNMLKFALFLWTFLCVHASYSNLANIQKVSQYMCHKEFCKSVICETIDECPGGYILQNGSFCNCCDLCIKYLKETEQCENPVKGSLSEIGKSECQIGLKCLNGKCVLDETVNSCLLMRSRRLKQKSQPYYADDLWIPECDERGNFKAKQQKKRKSICLDPYGKKIFGQEMENSGRMTCECSRYINELKKGDGPTFLTKPQERCSTIGNFDILQCIDDLCFCADELTGEIQGRIAKRDFIDKLPCYDEKTSSKNYLKPCEKELIRSRLLRHQFLQKGIEVVGLENIVCDMDGTYAPKQCDAVRCVCTDKYGVGIGSYVELSDKYQAEMTCNCARDGSSSQFSIFKCKGHGNYVPFQCFDGDKCFCVDEDGDFISHQLQRVNVSETFCKDLLQRLYTSHEEIPTTTTSTTTTSTSEVTHDDSSYEYL